VPGGPSWTCTQIEIHYAIARKPILRAARAWPGETARVDQNFPFVASFAAFIISPVICLICSPALVN
jgi:hypothetical protein